MKPLKLSLRGPMSLLDGDDGRDFLFAHPEAWQPGIYLWTFFHNQCDRINKVGVADDSVALTHAGHVAAFLSGEYAFHSAADLEAGRLRRIFEPHQGAESFAANAADLLLELHRIRVFFTPIEDDAPLRARVATAITAHIENLGGKAMEWFDAARAGDILAFETVEPVSVQFYRPVVIVNMPDELSV